MGLSLRTTRQQRLFRASKSDEVGACEQAQIQVFVEAKRSDLQNGLTRRQRTFILEKLVGLNDKDAALAAGYSLSVAENTKQRIWKPQVRAEWERLRCEVATGIKWVPLSTDDRAPDGRSSLPQQPGGNGSGAGATQ
jgi:hypothetical protein